MRGPTHNIADGVDDWVAGAFTRLNAASPSIEVSGVAFAGPLRIGEQALRRLRIVERRNTLRRIRDLAPCLHHGDDRRLAARHAHGLAGADIVRRAPLVGANLDQALGHVHHVFAAAGGHREGGPLHHGGEQRRLNLKMTALAAVHLEQQRTHVLQDAGETARGIWRDRHSAVGGHDDTLGAVLDRRAALPASGDCGANRERNIHARIGETEARLGDTHHPLQFGDAPERFIGERFAAKHSGRESSRRHKKVSHRLTSMNLAMKVAAYIDGVSFLIICGATALSARFPFAT